MTKEAAAMPVPPTANHRPATPASPASPATPFSSSDRLLRTALRVDGWSTTAFGVVMLAGSPWLDGPLGLPALWSVLLGLVMPVGGAALLFLAARPRIAAGLAAAVVVGNTACAAAMLLVAFADVLPLTGAGVVFMVSGALAVAVFAELELIGLRRSVRTGRNGRTALAV
ncbi:hypothetical protein ACFCV8_18890 [Streptomyces sp. NPDC056347]|uniref:hypothetical protein n=1 Tax=Streptomyces sp. NPDC056347 TaxID=3345790 RepID=UPI0035D8231D